MEDKLGTIFDVPFEVGLLTDKVTYDVNVMGTDAPKNIANNGIARDGGITEVYQSQPALTNPSSVYYTSNGHTIHIDSADRQTVYIDNVKQLKLDSTIAFRQQLKINGYGDCSISTTGTFLCLRYNGTQFVLNELDDTGTVLNTKSCAMTAGVNNVGCFCMVIDNAGQTFANTLYFIYTILGVGVYSIDQATATSNQILTTSNYGFLSGAEPDVISSYKVGSGYVFSGISTKGIKESYNGTAYPSNGHNIEVFLGVNDTSITTISVVNSFFANATYRGAFLTKNFFTGTLYVIGILRGVTSASMGSLSYAGGHIVCTFIDSTTLTNFSDIVNSSQNCVTTVRSSTNLSSGNLLYTITDISSGAVLNYGTLLNISPVYVPDCSSNQLIGTNIYLSIKNVNGLNALICLSSNISDQGNPLCAFGDMYNKSQVFTYSQSATVGKVMFRNSDGNYTVIRYGNDINYSYSEIANGTVIISVGSSYNIIDSNSVEILQNSSSFITSTLTPFVLAPTNYTYNTFSYNKYSQCVDIGSYLNCQVNNLFFSTTPASFSYSFNTGVFVNGFGIYFLQGAANNGYLYTFVNNPAVNALNFTYVPSPYEPIPITAGYDFRNGMALLNNGSAVGSIGLANYDGTAGFLLQQYQASFRLYGQLYAFDGEYIYNIPLSAGSSGAAGTPVQIAIANGLKFLCQTPMTAVFLSDYDNTLFIFSGGRDVEKLICLNQKPAIVSAAYCVNNEELVIQTQSSLLYLRSGIISEMPAPYTPYTNYVLRQSNKAVWAVNTVTGSLTAYFYNNVNGSTLIPINLQTAYYGYGSNRMKVINRIVVRILYKGLAGTPLTITWNWITDISNGTSTATVTPVTDANGYGIFDYVPNPNYVMAGSLGIASADATQKKVLLSITAFIQPSADAQTLNHAL